MATKNESDSNLESTISMYLGIFVVIVVGFLLYRYFRNNISKQTEKTVLTEEVEETPSLENEFNEESKSNLNENLPSTYEVKAGDTLWSISMKYFGSGYNFVDVAKENNLKNNNVLFVGQKLTIPKVSPRLPLGKTVAVEQENSIQGNSYTVIKGDSLWNISVRAYQDGYKWVLIAKTNNLSNPNIIHPGNVLIIPR